MQDIAKLTNHLFLWHLTPGTSADRIAVEGFRPKGPPRQNHVSRAIWFSNSGFGFTKRVLNTRKRDAYEAYLVALPIPLLDHSWNGQVADEFTAFQPLPPDIILARIPAPAGADRDTLRAALLDTLGTDTIDRLASLCTREDIPWHRLTSPAAQLMYLDRSRYETENLSALALHDGLPSLSLPDCVERIRSATTIDFRFYHYILRQYYTTYGERHIARALLTAAARRIGVNRVVSICCDPSADPGHNLVARFLADLLPHIPKPDLVFAMIELRSERTYRESRQDADRLEDWILNQPESHEYAAWFIEHAHDHFHARRQGTVIPLAARILAKYDTDPFTTLRRLGESPFPDVRRGVAAALGELREERGIDYLEQCLDTRWKAMREDVITSLGHLKSERARTLVVRATRDRAGRVRRSAERALSGS